VRSASFASLPACSSSSVTLMRLADAATQLRLHELERAV
jgi:hypothetical protein